MRVDVVLDPTDCPVGELARTAALAEEVGFDGVFTYDHLSGAVLGGGDVRHVWPTLAAIATATSRVAVGPLVVDATRRHPVDVAVAAATLQELSAGRLVLGMGAGAGPGSPFARELTMAGLTPMPARTRRRILVESVETIRALWAGRSFTGAHFGLVDPSGFLVPEPAPPILVGANGPLVATLAGRIAEGVNVHVRSVSPDVTELVQVARAAASEAGHDGFVCTVETPMDAAWLDPDRPEGASLAGVAVDRVMMRWNVEREGLAPLRDVGAALADL